MGWTRSGSTLVSRTAGTSASAVPATAKWYIKSNSNGYYIYSYGGTAYTVTSGANVSDSIVLQSYSVTNKLQNWKMTKLSISEHGVTLKKKTGELVAGNTYTFTAGVYSTYSSVYGQNGMTWSVTNGTGSATVNPSTGVLTGVSLGTVTVTASYKYSSSKTWSTSYSVRVVPFADGFYFFNNREKGGYMQIDDDASDYSASGTHMEHHDFDGEDYQKWELISLKNGYYKIVSVESGLALSVPSGKESTMDVNLVQEAYISATRQQWEFIETSDGAYKIKARSATDSDKELVICVNAGTDSGTNIQQDDYVSNTSYLDEWYAISEKDASLIALPEDYDRSSYFSNVISDLSSIGYSDCYNNHATISAGVTQGELIGRIANSKITLIRTHGLKTLIETSDGDLTRGDILDLPSNSFNYAELVIYGACLTGDGRDGASNLVNATHERGAKTVIGFEKSVWSTEVNWWCEQFLEALVNGYTVQEACAFADAYIAVHWPEYIDVSKYPITTSSHYIAGDKTATFSN